MFSPDAAVPTSVAARNPRRRQRTGSDDSAALRQNVKRIRRSDLTPETFQPLATKKINGNSAHVAEETFTNGHAKEPENQRHSTNLAIRHRGVKKGDRERRTGKNDGSIELASAHVVQSLQDADFNRIRLRMRTTLSLSCQRPLNPFEIITLQVWMIKAGKWIWTVLICVQENGMGTYHQAWAMHSP